MAIGTGVFAASPGHEGETVVGTFPPSASDGTDVRISLPEPEPPPFLPPPVESQEALPSGLHKVALPDVGRDLLAYRDSQTKRLHAMALASPQHEAVAAVTFRHPMNRVDLEATLQGMTITYVEYYYRLGEMGGGGAPWEYIDIVEATYPSLVIEYAAVSAPLDSLSVLANADRVWMVDIGALDLAATDPKAVLPLPRNHYADVVRDGLQDD